MFNVKVFFQECYFNIEIQTKCEDQFFNIKVPPNQLFQSIQLIVFKPQYRYTLGILSKQINTIPLNQISKVQALCERTFQIKIEIDLQNLVLQFLMNQAQNLSQYIDKLSFKQICAMIKVCYDNLSSRLHGKCNRKFKKYFIQSKRQQNEKKSLISLLEMLKQDKQNQVNKLEIQNKNVLQKSKEIINESNKNLKPYIKYFQTNIKNENKYVQKVGIIEHNNKKRNDNKNQKGNNNFNNYNNKNNNNSNYHRNNRNNRNNNNNNNNNNSNSNNNNSNNNRRYKQNVSKQNYISERKIILGINGDVDKVWREYLRPPRIQFEQLQQKQEMNELDQEIYSKYKKEQIPLSLKKQQNKSLQKIFSIPNDGNKFHIEKNKQYNFHINNDFWVKIGEKNLSIQKQGKGFIRKCQIDLLPDNNGFMGDGILISFNGLCSLEDGGIIFGDAKITDFIPKGSTYFALKQLDIYSK